jgi:DNA-binding response OmpR family regulator
MNKKKIVLIDDNKDYTFTMGIFLERNGFTVFSAHDGKEGIELIKAEKPDLVLLDVMMEVLFSGFEVCRQVRQDASIKDTPIFGISGMGEEINVKFDEDADKEYFSPNEFFEKPVDKDALLAKINKYIA